MQPPPNAPARPSRPAFGGGLYRANPRAAARVAECVFRETARLARSGRELHFWTWTFPTPLFDRNEAQRRWNSYATGWLRRYLGARGPIVWERHRSGAWHLHGVTVDKWTLPGRWVERNGRWRFHGDLATKARWRLVRDAASRHGFGRVQVTPARNPEAVPRYLAKYITAALSQRRAVDKGRRFTGFLGYIHKDQEGNRISQRTTSTRFAWHSRRATATRAQIAVYAANQPHRTDDLRWIFRERGLIATTPALHPDEGTQAIIDATRASQYAASWRFLARLARTSESALKALQGLADSLTISCPRSGKNGVLPNSASAC